VNGKYFSILLLRVLGYRKPEPGDKKSYKVREKNTAITGTMGLSRSLFCKENLKANETKHPRQISL
jgi:hypothetical protein